MLEAGKKIYFLSDAHLGAQADVSTLDDERRLCRWLDSVKHSAKAIYMLGDMFDFWFEYRYVVPRGHTRFLGKLAELSDAGVELHFFTGNHDIWTFGYLETEIGITIHRREEIVTLCGKRFFLAHGDGLGDPSRRFWWLRFMFHNSICQRLFAALPTRWAMSVGLRWSGSSRHKKTNGNRYAPFLGEENEHLIRFAKQYAGEPVDFFVFGHRHILLDFPLDANRRLIILGDWITLFSYAEFDGENLLLKQFED